MSNGRLGLRTRPGLIRGYSEGFQSPASYLLDVYTSAFAAFSIRKLNSTYTGNAIKVRRSSDNVEQDIGFNSDGYIDTDALNTFISSNSGFVVTWYDQSGNARNLTQTSATKQPRIVNAGALDILGGKAALLFDGSNDNLISAGETITSVNTVSIIAVCRSIINNTDTSDFLTMTGSQSNLQSIGLTYAIQRKPTIFIWGGTETAVTNSFDNQNLTLAINTASTQNIWINGSNNANSVITNSLGLVNGRIIVGQNLGELSVHAWQGEVQEIIYYHSNQSSNRTGIESNINNYYAIY